MYPDQLQLKPRCKARGHLFDLAVEHNSEVEDCAVKKSDTEQQAKTIWNRKPESICGSSVQGVLAVTAAHDDRSVIPQSKN